MPSRQKPFRALKLRAEDAEDLTVIAAYLQDALIKTGEMIYWPKQRRFALVLQRYVWESEGQSRLSFPRHWRVTCGVHFDHVLAIKSRGIDRSQPDAVLELLTIGYEPRREDAAVVRLVFAGGGEVELELECIDLTLSDIGQPWAVPLRPEHGLKPPEPNHAG
jgi:hypothetical protein